MQGQRVRQADIIHRDPQKTWPRTRAKNRVQMLVLLLPEQKGVVDDYADECTRLCNERVNDKEKERTAEINDTQSV